MNDMAILDVPFNECCSNLSSTDHHHKPPQTIKTLSRPFLSFSFPCLISHRNKWTKMAQVFMGWPAFLLPDQQSINIRRQLRKNQSIIASCFLIRCLILKFMQLANSFGGEGFSFGGNINKLCH